jgi:hypothetical protein
MPNKVFTTEFRYKGMTYSALISLRPIDADHSVYVQLNDRALHHIVPDGEFHFRMSQGLRKAADPKSGVDRELLQAIREAVLRYITPTTQLSDPY